MKKNLLKISLLVIFFIVLLIITVKFLAILSFPENKEIIRIDRSFPTDDSSYDKTKPATLYPSSPVTQKIIGRQNNLNQINIAFENFPRQFGDQIILSLGDADCNAIYSRSIGFFSFWRDTIYTRFTFPRISNSQGKTYCLEAKFIPKEYRTSNLPRISTFRSPGESFFNAGEKGGKNNDNTSLIFKSAYSDSDKIKNVQTLLDRISQYKPPFFKGVSLAIILLLSFLSTILLILLFIIIL